MVYLSSSVLRWVVANSHLFSQDEIVAINRPITKLERIRYVNQEPALNTDMR